MTPLAVLADDHVTSSNAVVAQPCAQVVFLGAVSMQPAEPHLGTAEEAIDYATGAAALHAAGDVEEAASSPVSTGSPFGI